MRLFVSYRRDDTSGRAGRLSDGLRQRLGPQNVFQDVASISPGVDFERAIDASLRGTDATIVVIGPDWADAAGPAGDRRLDEPTDYVRREVAAALESGGPVVPVLVGEARMPGAETLPADLQPLVRRQAISLRDVAWNEDVDGLVRALREEIDPGRGRRRKAVLLGGLVLVAAAAAVAVVIAVRSGDGGGTPDAAADLPPCAAATDQSVSVIPLLAEPVGAYDLTDGSERRLGYAATALRAQERDGRWRVLVDVAVANRTTPVEGPDDEWHVDPSDFPSLAIDGVEGPAPACFNLVSGPRQVQPGGEAALVRLGFNTPSDPRDSELQIVTHGTPIPLAGGQ